MKTWIVPPQLLASPLSVSHKLVVLKLYNEHDPGRRHVIDTTKFAREIDLPSVVVVSVFAELAALGLAGKCRPLTCTTWQVELLTLDEFAAYGDANRDRTTANAI